MASSYPRKQHTGQLKFRRWHVQTIAMLLGLTTLAGCASQPVQEQTAVVDEAIYLVASKPKPQKNPAPANTQLSTLHKRYNSTTHTDATPKKPPPPTDLWGHLQKNLSWNCTGNIRIDAHKKQLLTDKKYLKRAMVRAEPFLHHIVRRLDENDMPMELALLPLVESAYHPLAHSSARAAGIWQFIPSTGKLYGLEQNWWYDGRYDVLAATDAAIKLLKSDYSRFDDNWLHALAAYNSGATTVKRAIKRNKKDRQSTSYWHLKLPRETRHYIPKLLAWCDILKNARQYEVDLPNVPRNKPTTIALTLDRPLRLSDIAESMDMSMKELHWLNSGFKRDLTPKGRYKLLVPNTATAQQLQDRINRLPTPNNQPFIYYVRSGDTLYEIAKRYKTSIAELKKHNQVRRDGLIRIGQQLTIANASNRPDLELLHHRLHPNSPYKMWTNTHKVRKGDTLWQLARRHRTSVREIASLNNISPDGLLQPGQKLLITNK